MTISKNLSLVGLGFVALLMLVAAPASATTVAGYYDQFGNYHFYETYTYSGQGSNYGYANQNMYGNGVYNVRPITYTNSYNSCPTGTVYNSFNALCAPVAQQTGSTVGGFSNGFATTAGTSKTATGLTGSSKSSGSTNGQASALSTLFGSKSTGPLAITGITVVSGPKNINDESSETNCAVFVSWTTNVASAGQVVYGTTSQPKVDSFSYPSVVAESTSYQKQHQVKLGCLSNTTYYFRVIAFSKTERAVSDEQTIFPIKIRTGVPVVGSTSGATGVSGGASAFSTVAKILMSPIVLIILMLLAAAYIIMKIVRKGAGAHGASHGSAPSAHAEPALEIPHH